MMIDIDDLILIGMLSLFGSIFILIKLIIFIIFLFGYKNFYNLLFFESFFNKNDLD